MNCSDFGKKLHNLLGLKHSAVAIAFMDKPPSGMAPVKTPAPASCSYWKMASDGETFYTAAEDHQNCTIGAYTHGVKLGPEKSKELQATLSQMIDLQYLQEADIPKVPHRDQLMQVAAYSPLEQSPFEPQIVLIRGNAKHLMLITEATSRAGIAPESTMMRPTCAALPQSLNSGRATASFACIGNRIYTGLGDDELYCVIPGSHLGRVITELEAIVRANATLREFHQGRSASAA